MPGGHAVFANWANGERNDLDRVETAVANASGKQPLPEGWLKAARKPESTSSPLAAWVCVEAGLVVLPWSAADDRELVHAVLFAEDPDALAKTAPTVLAAPRSGAPTAVTACSTT